MAGNEDRAFVDFLLRQRSLLVIVGSLNVLRLLEVVLLIALLICLVDFQVASILQINQGGFSCQRIQLYLVLVLRLPLVADFLYAFLDVEYKRRALLFLEVLELLFQLQREFHVLYLRLLFLDFEAGDSLAGLETFVLLVNLPELVSLVLLY